MRRPMALLGIIGGLVVALAYTNCSPEHATEGASGSSVVGGVSFIPCAFKDEMDLFSKTYHGFLTNNCSACHVEGGVGKGAFASSGLLVAYNAFSVVGFDMVSNFAVNPGHKPPYTGTQLQPDVDLLRQQWVKGLENIQLCKSGGGNVDPNPIDESQRIETRNKGINAPANGGFVTLRWDLNTEILARAGITLPEVPGASLEVRVRRITLGATPVYEISSPRVVAGATTDIKILSLIMKLNGRVIQNQTTFRFVDENVYRNTTVLLAPGSMVVDGVVAPTDTLAVSIGRLEALTLPPAPIPPLVNFELGAQSVSEPDDTTQFGGALDVPVYLTLSEANTSQFVTVSVNINNTGVPVAEQAANRRSMTVSFNGNDLVIDRWDWDYSIDTTAVVFEPGEVRKPITIKVAKDQRDENNERIRLVIASVNNGRVGATSASILTVVDNDNPDVSGAPTFSQLMQQNGVLFANCLECHNSVDNRGGYNLSDYDLMVANGVLVPGNPTASDMWVRMASTIPGLRPMPLTGLLPNAIRDQVRLWILGGAKNN